MSTPTNSPHSEHRFTHFAEEQVLYLHRTLAMSPDEIIHTYTGHLSHNANFSDAVETVCRFNTRLSQSA